MPRRWKLLQLLFECLGIILIVPGTSTLVQFLLKFINYMIHLSNRCIRSIYYRTICAHGFSSTVCFILINHVCVLASEKKQSTGASFVLYPEGISQISTAFLCLNVSLWITGAIIFFSRPHQSSGTSYSVYMMPVPAVLFCFRSTFHWSVLRV